MSLKKLAARIKKDFDIDLDLHSFRRCYPGYWQRSNGAWSWTARADNKSGDYGSSFSISDLLKAKELTIYDGEFLPK